MDRATINYKDFDVPESTEITAFQKRVYGATRLIPSGYVSTYGCIAKAIQCKSAQAVGQALRRNPWPIDLKGVDNNLMVPCHRVIGHGGFIGGFSGKRSGAHIHRKIKLLEKEGVAFVLNEKSKKYELRSDMTNKLVERFRKINISCANNAKQVFEQCTDKELKN